jgi:hypothetical protein
VLFLVRWRDFALQAARSQISLNIKGMYVGREEPKLARTRIKEQKSRPPRAKKQRSKVAHPWDFWMKELARQEPQALVSLLLPGAVFLDTIDKELRGRTVAADPCSIGTRASYTN